MKRAKKPARRTGGFLTLGIETSCDETSVAFVQDGRKILSNSTVSSLAEHRPYGGVVPEIASRAHVEAFLGVLEDARKKARVELADADLIAVTNGPGLMGSLLVGLAAAKALSLALSKPIVGVDHVLAHAYSGVLGDAKPAFPFVALVVSGGHTLLLRFDSASRSSLLGRTIDDAAGEAFDKVAKMLGLGYPGGPEIDRLAKGTDPSRFPFTRPYLSNASLNFSFSGLKTAVYHEVERLKKMKALTPQVRRGLASGFQEAVCDVLVQKGLQAVASERVKTLVLGGGVSANSRLRARLKSQAKKTGVRLIVPSLALCQDNAAMIAALGAALYKEGHKDTLSLGAYAQFSAAGRAA